MEVCAPCDKAISESLKAYTALLAADDLKKNPQSEIFNCLVSNLENCITQHLHINDAQKSESITNSDAINNVKKSESSSDCIDSPRNNVMLHLDPISSYVEEDKAEVIPKTDIQEPVRNDGGSDVLPIVSAIKGSREKHGLSPKKLTVTWAPDVYDPIPTSVSHSVTRGKNKQRLQNKRSNSKKKNGKNKQKGSTSRGSGSGGKVKKQSRKVGSSNYDRFMDPSYRFEDFKVGMPNPDYCGSDFLIQSLTKVHYSTAEAL